MIVSNTSPLNYLILIGHVQVLEALHGRVAIPAAVFTELQALTAPRKVQEWMAAVPPWCTVHAVVVPPDPSLDHLHAGEREAILLTQALQVGAVIIDERDGRNAATERKLRVTGTLGILDEAAEQGLLDFPQAVALLKATSFHAADKLYRQFLARDAERRERGLRPSKSRSA